MKPEHRLSAVSLALIFTLSSLARAEEFRTFTNTQGQAIEAKVTALSGDQVSITMKDGRSFTIPVSTLSPADQAFLKEWKPGGAPSAPPPLADQGGVGVDALNEAIGHPLFKDLALWDSDPKEVATRLNWPRESETPFAISFRSYPKDDYRFLGARPFSAALYGEEGKVTGVSIVFANKGDSFGAKGSGEEHFIKGEPVPGGIEGFRMIMENDAELIETALTSLLGDPESQQFGDGETRTRVERWDWNGHAFLLSNVEDEYVSLAIETVEFAEKRGRVSRVPEKIIRERARSGIETRENGDVIITNIPMVDQGPKGYCAPATAERCMRYLGVPADMYLLAMVGQTQMGGGTSVDLLLQNIGRDIKRKGRKFDKFDGDLKLRTVKRYIDGGIPVMWTLFSTPDFNQLSNARSKERKETEDFAAYSAKVTEEAKDLKLNPDTSTGHVVIIIGYNEETGEIAFSDSWGERYQERWITIPQAEQVSQKRFYVIDL